MSQFFSGIFSKISMGIPIVNIFFQVAQFLSYLRPMVAKLHMSNEQCLKYFLRPIKIISLQKNIFSSQNVMIYGQNTAK